MKKLFLLAALIAALCTAAGCQSNKSKTEDLVNDIVSEALKESGADASDLEDAYSDIASSILGNMSSEDVEALSELSENSSLEEISNVLGNMGGCKYSAKWDNDILPEGFPSEPAGLLTKSTEFDPEYRSYYEENEVPHERWSLDIACNSDGLENINDAFISKGFIGQMNDPDDYNEYVGIFYSDGYYVAISGYKAYDKTYNDNYDYSLYINITIPKTYEPPKTFTDLFPIFNGSIPVIEEYTIEFYDDEYNTVDEDSSNCSFWIMYKDYIAVSVEEAKAYAKETEKRGYTVKEYDDDYSYSFYATVNDDSDKEGLIFRLYKNTHAAELQASNKLLSINY